MWTRSLKVLKMASVRVQRRHLYVGETGEKEKRIYNEKN